jgi:nicotinamide-nucleotide amidase
VIAQTLVSALSEQGQTVAVAESLTGGLLCSTLVEVPGASAVVRGGVVAYATELKHRLLGVDADLLAGNGAVDPDVAAQMALGVRDRLGADWGLATTGVAGPDPQDGIQPGRVYVAVAGPLGAQDFEGPSEATLSMRVFVNISGGMSVPDGVGTRVLRLDLPGGRMAVRTASTERAVDALLDAVLGFGAARGTVPGADLASAPGPVRGVAEHGGTTHR